MNRKNNERRGIRLSRFNAMTAGLIILLALLLLLSTFLTSRGYSRAEQATDRYITAQQAAANMQAASDFLTAQARAFAATGDISRAEAFFEETDVTRRRDHALEDIDKIMDSPSTYSYLSAALENSNELLKIEWYAMRLAAESYGYALGDCPKQLSDVTLKDDDLGLSAEEQRDKALILLFDDTYQSYKDRVRENVALSVEVLISETREQQKDSSGKLLQLIHREEFLIIVMLLLAVLLVVMTSLLITRPLRRYNQCIKEGEMLPEEGALELRFLAKTYNQVREQNLRHRDQLSYDATHDPLTGVFNRGVFEKLRSRCEGRDIAMLIIDLDKFKSINDQYGHDGGDKALCCVAALLQENFRAEDYICRIGGDEFAVIMVNVNSSMQALVEDKIRRMNEILKTPKDDVPPVSLSVGVAFGDRKNPTDDIFKDADTALYRAKNTLRGTCQFY